MTTLRTYITHKIEKLRKSLPESFIAPIYFQHQKNLVYVPSRYLEARDSYALNVITDLQLPFDQFIDRHEQVLHVLRSSWHLWESSKGMWQPWVYVYLCGDSTT